MKELIKSMLQEHQLNETKKKSNGIHVPLKVGDIILTGKFKNKKTVVKDIGEDEHGMPTINGKRACNFRLIKK